jgi:hypothetical protein
MRIVGGEAELDGARVYEYITDSGRSSLKLLLNTLKTKKFLVPNYLCEIVLYVFNELQIDYSFYNIADDLSIDIESIRNKDYDVLYLISYFGQCHDIYNAFDNSKIIVEDNVFLPLFERPKDTVNWIGFNSFRKATPIANGSLIKSTIKLDDKLILKKESEFESIKYKAKKVKYEYLKNNKYSEEEYLSLFNLAESKLDEQNTINTMSTYSLCRLFEFMAGIEIEYSIRRKNFNALDKYLERKAVKIKTNYPSFYVLSINERDALRKHLFSKKVYLAVHWPHINGVSNNLYDRLISIPVDSRYNEKDMAELAHIINDFYKA